MDSIAWLSLIVFVGISAGAQGYLIGRQRELVRSARREIVIPGGDVRVHPSDRAVMTCLNKRPDLVYRYLHEHQLVAMPQSVDYRPEVQHDR